VRVFSFSVTLWTTTHQPKAERTKDVATKPSDAGFFSGAARGLFGGAIMGAIITVMALTAIVR
jgi:predicted lipid-binding transport protein (Tim44 family)